MNMSDSVEKLNKLKQRPHLLVKLEKANSQNKWKSSQNTSNNFSHKYWTNSTDTSNTKVNNIHCTHGKI